MEMVPLPEDANETGSSEVPQQPGDRLRQEQRKELASLDQQASADTEMDEKKQGMAAGLWACSFACDVRSACMAQRQAALMTSLEQGETRESAAAEQCTVSATDVQKLQDLLLLPAAEVEAALQQAEGNYLKATQMLLERDL